MFEQTNTMGKKVGDDEQSARLDEIPKVRKVDELEVERGLAPELEGEDEMTIAGRVEDCRLPGKRREREKGRRDVNLSLTASTSPGREYLLRLFEVDAQRAEQDLGGLDRHELRHLGFEKAGKDLVAI